MSVQRRSSADIYAKAGPKFPEYNAAVWPWVRRQRVWDSARRVRGLRDDSRSAWTSSVTVITITEVWFSAFTLFSASRKMTASTASLSTKAGADQTVTSPLTIFTSLAPWKHLHIQEEWRDPARRSRRDRKPVQERTALTVGWVWVFCFVFYPSAY